MNHIFCKIITLCLSIAFTLVSSPSFADTSDQVDPGQITFREPVQMHNETIDPFTGHLTLSYTDLSLPGDGGLDLNITRTYKSERVTDIGQARDSILGFGWDLHFGFLKKQGKTFLIGLPDGTESTAYPQGKNSNGDDIYVTKDFWKLIVPLVNPPVLWLTDGKKITFNKGGDLFDSRYYATEIRKNNNTIIVEYSSQGGIVNAISRVSFTTDNKRKYIYFNYGSNGQHLSSISWNLSSSHRRVITFRYTSDNRAIASVTMPEDSKGPDVWRYTYEDKKLFLWHNPAFILRTVTTPQGGKYTYTFGTKNKSCNGGIKTQASLITKTVSGRNVPAGTWSYNYGTAGGFDTTEISAPNGRTEEFNFFGYGSSFTGFNGSCYKYGLMDSRTVTEGSLQEKTEYSWSKLPDQISSSPYNVHCGCSDQRTYVPILTEEKTTRDGTVYTTQYTEDQYDNHGNPGEVKEIGSHTTTTTTTYWKNLERNMVKGKPDIVKISGDSPEFTGNFTVNYDYHTNSNFYGSLSRVNKYGVSTRYWYYNNGNLRSITDANNKKTFYEWSNGSVDKISNPIYTISRKINWDGTVESETNGEGHTTKYKYDDNMRLTLIDPPLGHSTVINYLYDSNGFMTGKKEQRGVTYKQTDYDGLGRASKTTDHLGITTTTKFKANGRQDYIDSNIGDKTIFDALGRTSQIVHKDNYSIRYFYTNDSEVEILDEVDNPTTLTFSYFGDPEEKYLTSHRDAYNNVTEYTYNILGNLTKTQRGSLERSFAYDSKNFLQRETHPESGTIYYDVRDNVGNLKTKRENGKTINYSYDDINRLRTSTSGTYFQNFEYDKNDNIKKISSPKVVIEQKFDGNGRMEYRKSTINGKAGKIAYTYTAYDKIWKITYPSKTVVEYKYDNKDRVSRILGFGGHIKDITYHQSGEQRGLLKEYLRSNNQKVTFNWDKRRQLVRNSHNKLYLSYGYYPQGNLKSLNRTSGRNQGFVYDDINRLTSFTFPGGSGSYSYDDYDNRESKRIKNVTTNYSYDRVTNKLTRVGGKNVGYTYGNIKWYKDMVLNYSPFNNITTVTKFNKQIGYYLYDGQNRRVFKSTDNPTTIHYHYGQSDNVLSEIAGNGQPLSDYIYLGNTLVAKSMYVPPVPPLPKNVNIVPFNFLLLKEGN